MFFKYILKSLFIKNLIIYLIKIKKNNLLWKVIFFVKLTIFMSISYLTKKKSA